MSTRLIKFLNIFLVLTIFNYILMGNVMIKLFELRSEKGLSQRELARIMNISQGTYNNWENENTQPSIEQLIALADFFEVSVDYLLGRTDENGTVIQSAEQKNGQELLKLYKTADKDVQTAILTILKNLK